MKHLKNNLNVTVRVRSPIFFENYYLKKLGKVLITVLPQKKERKQGLKITKWDRTKDRNTLGYTINFKHKKETKKQFQNWSKLLKLNQYHQYYLLCWWQSIFFVF